VTKFPSGSYRRRIRVVATRPDLIEAGLEDDFHYFKVQLHHDGTRVTACEAESLRWPWSTCPGAAEPLRALAGMPLSDRCLAVGEWTDPHLNCTHMFDLAGLSVAHASRTTRGDTLDARQYDVKIPFGAQWGGEHDVEVARDGELLLTWTLDGRRCISPPPFSEVPWKGGFLKWADTTFEPEQSEPVIVLRRACDIGMGRGMDLDGIECADELPPWQAAVCHTMQPQFVHVAVRNKGTTRDYDTDLDALLSEGP
jgi:hypothetical protein